MNSIVNFSESEPQMSRNTAVMNVNVNIAAINGMVGNIGARVMTEGSVG